mgnify:CR=1 FL=1
MSENLSSTGIVSLVPVIFPLELDRLRNRFMAVTYIPAWTTGVTRRKRKITFRKKTQQRLFCRLRNCWPSEKFRARKWSVNEVTLFKLMFCSMCVRVCLKTWGPFDINPFASSIRTCFNLWNSAVIAFSDIWSILKEQLFTGRSRNGHPDLHEGSTFPAAS